MKTNGKDTVRLSGPDLGTGGCNCVNVDRFGALVGVEQKHYHIQNGEFFTVYSYDGDVDTAAPKKWLLRTTGLTEIHWAYILEASDAGLLVSYSSPTVTSDGTKLTPSNNKLGDPTTVTGMEFFEDPVISSNGTPLGYRLIGSEGGGPQGGSGGSVDANVKHVIGVPVTILFEFTPTNNDTKVNFIQYLYEVHKRLGN